MDPVHQQPLPTSKKKYTKKHQYQSAAWLKNNQEKQHQTMAGKKSRIQGGCCCGGKGKNKLDVKDVKLMIMQIKVPRLQQLQK